MGHTKLERMERMEARMSQSIECPNCRCEVPVALFASRIGKVRSEAKAKASIANGKKGGAPKGNRNWAGKELPVASFRPSKLD
jgi:hypothetical protein